MSGRSTVGSAFAFESSSGASLGLFSAVRKGDDQQYFDLLYVDGAAAFAANAQALANQIATESRPIMAADCRFFHGHRVEAECFEIVVPRFFKSDRVQPWQLDNLYSEVQQMGLKLD